MTMQQEQEEEASPAQAATIREHKKKRQKQVLSNAELDLILQDLHRDLQQLNVKKNDCIKNAAERMSAVVPKEMIAKELVQGLRLLRFKIDRSYIYRILAEKWPDVYTSGLLKKQQIDEDKDTEDSARNVREKYGISEGQEPEKMDFYRDFYIDGKIELDGGIIDEIKIATRGNYPDKVIIRQQKGKAVEIIKVIDNN
jgi:hypothetical protein